MKTTLVLTCLFFLGGSKVYGVSNKVLDFSSYYNGVYDNKEQTLEPGDDHVFIQASFIPVNLKCFLPNQSYYMEEVVNNITQFIGVGVVDDSIEDTVSVNIYTLVNYNKYKLNKFNLEKLSNIPCGEYQDGAGCVASFRVATNQGFVFGNVPNCGQAVNGTYPRFASMHTCTTATLTMPSPIEPYELRLIGKKFPLINPPKNYVPPCGN